MKRKRKSQTDLVSGMLKNLVPGRTLVLGIDEVGRGEFTGSMFVAGVITEMEEMADMKKLGIKDSKTLSKNRIRKLADIIRANSIAIAIEKISPIQIAEGNLNDLEIKAIAKIMYKLSNHDIVIVDNIEPTREAFIKRLKPHYPLFDDTTIIAEHKADENYSIVAAASIIAKDSRNLETAAIEKETHSVMGSGNSNDQKTLAWVKAHKDHWAVRRSWQTFKRLFGDEK